MAVFNVETITAKGLALIAKGQLGVEINFTRMQIGRGQLSGQVPAQLTALIDPISFFGINSMTRNGNSVQVRGIFENSGLSAPVHACELGVFADDPDDGEILYAYANAGTQGDNIPAFASGPFSKMYKFNLAVGNAEDVTVEVPAGAYIPEADKGVAGGVAPLDSGGVVPVENIPNIPVAKIPNGIDAAKIGNGSVSNAEFQTLDGVTSSIQTQLNSKSSTSDYVRQPGFAVTVGANAYTATLSPAPTGYLDGMGLRLKIGTTNTGACTLDVNGLGVRNLRNSKGNVFTAGQLVAGLIYSFAYSATTTTFILQGEGGEYGTATAADVLTGKTIGSDGGIVAGTMPNRAGDTAALASSVAGTTLKLRASNGYRNGTSDNVTITDPNFIAANIRNGVPLLGLIGSLVEGKKSASGSAKDDGTAKAFEYAINTSTISGYSLIVTGLSFKPSLVVAYNTVAPLNVILYTEFGDITYPKTAKFFQYSGTSVNSTVYNLKGDKAPLEVTSTGFKLPTFGAPLSTWNWAAIE